MKVIGLLISLVLGFFLTLFKAWVIFDISFLWELGFLSSMGFAKVLGISLIWGLLAMKMPDVDLNENTEFKEALVIDLTQKFTAAFLVLLFWGMNYVYHAVAF